MHVHTGSQGRIRRKARDDFPSIQNRERYNEPASPGLHRAEVNENTIVPFVGETIMRGGAVPSPSAVTGSHPQEPLRPLLSPAHQIGQIVHDPGSMLGVNVGEEGAVEVGVGAVFKELTDCAGSVADCAVAVQSHYGRGGSTQGLEALLRGGL